jgi:hypothetical protein
MHGRRGARPQPSEPVRRHGIHSRDGVLFPAWVTAVLELAAQKRLTTPAFQGELIAVNSARAASLSQATWETVVAVNWFEGGRRISKLFMVLVAAGGAAYVFFINVPMPTLTSRGPTMPWFVSDDECPTLAYERALYDYDWGGSKPGLTLCYLDIKGKIPYAVAPTPPEAKRQEEQEAAQDRARIARGEPPPLRLSDPWFYTADAYDQRVQSYVDETASSLKVTPELRQRLTDTRSKVWWRAHRSAFSDAAPWVMGLCAAIWLITAVIGWIVRGFAGVPTGQDFRQPKPEA